MLKMADVAVDTECNDPKELFGQGVRAFVLQDYEAAVSALSRASELLVTEHNDDTHESLGEVYLYYGKALLGLSREQNEALGDAVPRGSSEDSAEEEAEDEEEGKDYGENEKTEQNHDQSADSKNGEENGGGGEPGPSSSKEEDEPEENGEEETSDLQLAWEVLELAKKIFQKLDEKKNLAETLVVLGEVSLENESFEAAIADIKQGLELQQELFAKDSRTVAETLYKLGMAYSINSQLDEAIGSFNSSVEYLKNRIKTLEEVKSMTQDHKDEVEEIKGLIPDIEDKILDMEIYKDEVCVCKVALECCKARIKAREEEAAAEAASKVNKIEVRRAPRAASSIEEGVDGLTVTESTKSVEK